MTTTVKRVNKNGDVVTEKTLDKQEKNTRAKRNNKKKS